MKTAASVAKAPTTGADVRRISNFHFLDWIMCFGRRDTSQTNEASKTLGTTCENKEQKRQSCGGSGGKDGGKAAEARAAFSSCGCRLGSPPRTNATDVSLLLPFTFSLV